MLFLTSQNTVETWIRKQKKGIIERATKRGVEHIKTISHWGERKRKRRRSKAKRKNNKSLQKNTGKIQEEKYQNK